MQTTQKRMSTKTMVLTALLASIVIVLQSLGIAIRFGPFSISLVLVPIVIGCATCGAPVGTGLGLVFGGVVFFQGLFFGGDAAQFIAVSPWGTFITVMAKGALCGLLAAMTYKALEKKNRYVAVIATAIVCPIVNTGVFLLGCFAFFMETVKGWAIELGFGGNVGQYMIFGLVGGNFLVELAMNIVLSPVIVRLLNVRAKQH